MLKMLKTMTRAPLLRFAFAGALVLAAGSASAEAPSRLRLATTTSTDNSGLLEYLLPGYEQECDCTVDVIAVGTGKALRLGINGDVDAVLVHDTTRENAFVADGHGLYRRDVMWNDFVIVGPPADPASVRSARNLDEILRAMVENETTFISRGDESGTHSRERSLWGEVGIEPEGKWYRETGQGMGATLQVGSEMEGYVLTDRATFLAMKDGLELEILVEGDPRLINPYGAIPVRAPAERNASQRLAESFVAWLITPDVQTLIARFEKDGHMLFHPSAEGSVAAEMK